MRQPKFWTLGAWHRGKPRPLAFQLQRETIYSAEAIEVIARQFDLSEAELSTLLPAILDHASLYAISLDCATRQVKKIIQTKSVEAFRAEVEQYSGISRALANTYSGALYRLSSALHQLWHALCAVFT